MAPLVSVIVPTFNRATLLPRALESVQAQTMRDIELIVVDDGSTDETRQVVENFSDRSGLAVKYHWQENRGCAAARNTGISMAEGDFIHFLDSDDALVPKALQLLLDKLQHNTADFVYSPSLEVSKRDKEKINSPVAAGLPEKFSVEHFFNANARPGAILYVSEVVRAVGGFDESLLFNEDSDFLQRVALVGKATYCEHPTARMYYHAGSKSQNRVAIYKALLLSSERILRDNPEFSRIIGLRGSARLNQIRSQLTDALIAQGRFEEASDMIQTDGIAISRSANLSLSLHNKFPIQVRDWIRRKTRQGAWTPPLEE